MWAGGVDANVETEKMAREMMAMRRSRGKESSARHKQEQGRSSLTKERDAVQPW